MHQIKVDSIHAIEAMISLSPREVVTKNLKGIVQAGMRLVGAFSDFIHSFSHVCSMRAGVEK